MEERREIELRGGTSRQPHALRMRSLARSGKEETRRLASAAPGLVSLSGLGLDSVLHRELLANVLSPLSSPLHY